MNLIVDMNNAFYKSYFIYKLMYKDQEKINEKLLFNKFSIDLAYTLRSFSERTRISRVILCYDDKDNFRKRLNKEYKSNRTKQEESFYNVLNYSKKFFKELGFIVSQVKDLEADDLLLLWGREFQGDINCIISADEDPRQGLNDNTFFYNNKSKDKRFYFFSQYSRNHLDFVLFQNSQIFFEDPNWIVFKKMVLGCSGDNVKNLIVGKCGENKLKEKIFNNLSFNKDNVTYVSLENIVELINKTLKQNLKASDLLSNFSLIDLSGNSENDLWKNHKDENKDKFLYKGNYEFV